MAAKGPREDVGATSSGSGASSNNELKEPTSDTVPTAPQFGNSLVKQSTAPLNLSLSASVFEGAGSPGCSPGSSLSSSLGSSPVSSTTTLSSTLSATLSSTISTDKPDNNGLGPDMSREEVRLKSFDKWPLPFLRPQTLARNGFYYLGRGDEVRCAFCKVEIMRWEEGDDPAKDHQRWAPQCPFLRKQGIAASLPLDPASAVGHDECGVRSAPPKGANVYMPGPVHPKYASEAARLRTFKDWPKSMRQKPEELAEAGFYYTGHSDKTKCFYCDGGLKDWESHDIPWEQHARWFDRCAYVQLVKGREYVQKVISEACVVPEEKPAAAPAPEPAAAPAPEPEDSEELEDAKVCKICYAEERNVVFVPCGHVVACAKCALSTNKCPMCRRTFTSAVRLYYS